MKLSDYYDWHDAIMREDHDSILKCLGLKGERIVSIEKTDKGYKFLELCDEHYGTTLNQEQFERFIAELQELARASAPK